MKRSSSTKVEFVNSFARKNKVSAVTVRNWCKAGLIKGAYSVGRNWLIPIGSKVDKPTQGRPWGNNA